MIRAAAQTFYRALLPTAARRKVYEYREARAFRRDVRCAVCGGADIAPYTNPTIARLHFKLYRCAACSFIFVHPKPDPASYYSDTSVPQLGAAEPQWNAYYLDCIEKYAAGKGRLLEIGFGNGSFLSLARERGWDVYGADLSAPRVAHARDRLGLANVSCGMVEDVGFAEGSFDVVAAFNFIEHVPDLRATLRAVSALLRRGGLLVLLCPNIEGLYHLLVPELFGDHDPLGITWCPPEHLSYFNKANFRKLLESAGFAIAGDESRGTNLLWLQHEVAIGEEVGGERLQRLLDEIESSSKSAGDEMVGEFKQRIVELMHQRLAWTLVRDVMRIEPEVGAENAIFYVARKVEAGQ